MKWRKISNGNFVLESSPLTTSKCAWDKWPCTFKVPLALRLSGENLERNKDSCLCVFHLIKTRILHVAAGVFCIQKNLIFAQIQNKNFFVSLLGYLAWLA